MPETMTDAQDRLVAAIIATAPAQWRRIVADIEYLAEGGGFNLDAIVFAIVDTGQGLSDPQFDLSRDARLAVSALHDAMAGQDKAWGGLQLEIESTGAYRFEFDYREPQRLNGKWDAVRAEKLDNYLSHYKREHASGALAASQ